MRILLILLFHSLTLTRFDTVNILAVFKGDREVEVEFDISISIKLLKF